MVNHILHIIPIISWGGLNRQKPPNHIAKQTNPNMSLTHCNFQNAVEANSRVQFIFERK